MHSANYTNGDLGMEIKVRHPKSNKEMTLQWDCPTDLDALVKRFGKEVIANHAIAALRVAVQGIARGAMGGDKAKSPREIQQMITDYKPGIRVRGKTPQEKISETFSKMSPEQKKELLRRLSAA